MGTERCQTITLVLSDGRTVSYTGPVIVDDVDDMAGLGVSQVKIHPPKPLPPGTYFAQLDGDGEGGDGE